MNGLGGTGAQQAKDCSFAAGSVGGAPLRVSWFLVIFFIYQVLEANKDHQTPLWIRVARVTGNEFLLLLTVLTHEMGHGTMARRRGGDISQVLLWPFGGICFTTRAGDRTSRQKLVDDLWIVGAGPATHFPMAAAWMGAMFVARLAFGLTDLSSIWRHLVPWGSGQGLQPYKCDAHYAKLFPGMCLTTDLGHLVYMFLVQAIQLNVMLFIFNVFFPMYPMDGSKLIVCSLQLFCRVSARRAAQVLVWTSGPLAAVFIGYSLWQMHKGAQMGGGMFQGIQLYMGIMCAAEAHRIYKLLKTDRLHTHPLFEGARSDVISTVDEMGTAMRLNTSDRDDHAHLPQSSGIQFSEVRAFSGAGQTLAAPGAAQQAHGASEGYVAPGAGGRSQWLQRIEAGAAERGKSVRQLEDERVERERLMANAAQAFA